MGQMRKCHRCKTPRSDDLFYVNREQKIGYRLPCRVCQREMNRRATSGNREYVAALKASAGCADCGLRLPAHPEVFDFDHRPGGEAKVAHIAKLIITGTQQQIADEASKCDIVCSNCHRIRTASRQPGHFKGETYA